MSAQAFHRHDERDPRDRPGVATVLAIGLHVGLLVLIIASSWLKWNTDSSAAAGEPIVQASLVMSAADIRAAAQALKDAPPPLPKPLDESAQDAAPPPQPLPEPNPQTAQEQQQKQAQERVLDPDTKEQDEASKLAISQEKAAQEQEAKHRQEQMDLTESIKKQQEAQQKQRLAQQQLEEQQKQQAQQAADAEKQKKLDEIRKKLAAARQQTEIEQQKQQQVADAQKRAASSANAQQYGAQSQAPAGQGGDDNGLQAQYIAAIASAVQRQWIRPDSVPLGTKCVITIRQIPGGEVLGTPQVDASNCAMDAAGQDSLVRAVLKAQPLPYHGYESVFNRTLIVTFRAQAR